MRCDFFSFCYAAQLCYADEERIRAVELPNRRECELNSRHGYLKPYVATVIVAVAMDIRSRRGADPAEEDRKWSVIRKEEESRQRSSVETGKETTSMVRVRLYVHVCLQRGNNKAR